jgi:hypothetical protein
MKDNSDAMQEEKRAQNQLTKHRRCGVLEDLDKISITVFIIM